jgi:two-component system, OmpR family, response regulator RpaA
MGVARILIIEDDQAINGVYSRMLKRAGYEPIIADHGVLGLELARTIYPDLILLDISMPDVDGLQICQALREIPSVANIPILIVTGQTTTAACIAGLDTGGDDYIAKPFNLNELCARIRAHLRRHSQKISHRQASRLEIDLATGTVLVGGSRIRLTFLEQSLLNYFILHEGQAISNAQLIREVWGYAPESTDPGIVRWQIGALRKRIEPDPKHPRYILTIKQRGYLYRDPAQSEA